MKRKIIGVITSRPGDIYQQRVMEGLFRRCGQYEYDIAVFAPLVHVSHTDKAYLYAELNIFNLINFDLLDGILVMTLPLEEGEDRTICRKVLDTLRTKCTRPAVALDIPIGTYPCIKTDDIPSFKQIVGHLIDVHHCEHILFLNGNAGYHVSEKRLEGVREAFAERGLTLPEERIFHGDFWYPSGERLAEQIASHKIEMPDAVICANDHMAIGLIERLREHGISVPEQIRVTGFDATAEAAINEPAVTSCIPAVEEAAAKAIDELRARIEPEASLLPLPAPEGAGLTLCASCGCPENIPYIKQRLDSSLLHVHINYNARNLYHPDLYMLLEHYVPEKLTGSQDPDDCLARILGMESLIRPYSRFRLCLREDWLDTDSVRKDGYPEWMKTVIQADYQDARNAFCGSGGAAFPTAAMLPQLQEERSEPAVFYFTPVHFQEDTLGYAVLECPLSEKRQLDNVYHNWIRYVNTALEMVRTKNRLMSYSERDAMTGLLNRRGMERYIAQKTEEYAGRPCEVLCLVIDMDGLKHINDCCGHKEGDFAIRTIARAVETVTNADSEICVRVGGDEFLLLGIGQYPADEAENRVQRFYQHLYDVDRISQKSYEITASIGYASGAFAGKQSVDALFEQADMEMYQRKIERKKSRRS